MKKVKKYKTISILIALIIFFLVVTVAAKLVLPNFINEKPALRNPVILKSVPKDPFIDPKEINIPNSYFGYTVSKISSASAMLGKNAITYLNKPTNLSGDEWFIDKDNVSDFEYDQVQSYIKSTLKQKLDEKDWAEGSRTIGDKLKLNLNPVGLASKSGYLQMAKGKVQVLIIQQSRSKFGKVEIKVFLSKVTQESSFK